MRKLVKGNEAIVLGSLVAGCDAFFGYPITPASEISHLAAALYPRAGKVFLQAECEISAINMVFGAVAVGRRAMTSSSGPGISLKQETISYLAGAEVPAVIVDIMRAGPGIGNIGPEQSDYFQVVKGGGHGCYKVIVLAPNSVEEMYHFVKTAFDLADKYRTPVYILADAMLGQMMEPLDLTDDFDTDSPQTVPSKPWRLDTTAATNDNVLTTIYLSFDLMEQHVRHLESKYRQIETAECRVEEYRTDDATWIFSGYGIVSRILRSVVDTLRQQGHKVGMIRPQTLFPFPAAAFQTAWQKNGAQFVVVELSTGQYVEDVRLSVPSATIHHFSRLGGRLPTETEVLHFFLR